jgi:cytochrome P450
MAKWQSYLLVFALSLFPLQLWSSCCDPADMTELTAPRPPQLPRPPRSRLPKALQMGRWILDPVGYLRRQGRRHGDFYQVPISAQIPGAAPVFFLSEPQALQQLFSSDSGKLFSAPGEANELLASILGRHNTILLSGNAHRQRRQLLMPRFHGEHLQSYGRTMAQISQDLSSQWLQSTVIDVRQVMQSITMRIILHVVFGLDRSERYDQLIALLSQRLALTATPLTSAILFFPWLRRDLGSWSPGARVAALAERTDALLYAEIAARRAEQDPGRTDVLSLLLQASDAEGQPLSDLDLRDELMTLLLAGHETTATALTSAFYWLHRQPEVGERLGRELAALPGDAEPAALLNLPYLGAVVQEALRIHPVAMLTFPRQAEAPVELAGHRLHRGDFVMGNIYSLHHREDLYPDPDKFRPERFLERQYSPYEYMPFGAGVRRCVGAALAQMELKIVLGTLLRQLRFCLCNRAPVQPARRGVTLGHGDRVRLEVLDRLG